MELSDVTGSIRAHWRIAVGMVLLSVLVLAAFLVTRNEVRSANRFEASTQVLIPIRDPKTGKAPDVPPVLLQGQEALASSGSTTNAALKSLRFNQQQRAGLSFGVRKNTDGDVVIITARAADVLTARAAADGLADAYIRARAATVATTTKNAQSGARSNLVKLQKRLSAVNSQLRGIKLPPIVAPSTNRNGTSGTPTIALPTNLPLDKALLVYERNNLVNVITSTEASYAVLAAQSLLPKSYADIVEKPHPNLITPPQSSPLLPAAAIIAIGLALAVAVPVLIDRADHSIRDARSATAAFSAPVLTSIPAVSRSKLATLATPGSPRDGAFRSLAATCVATDRLPRAIMVTSPVGSIQDTVAANFGAALASMGLRVLLVATTTRQSWFLSDSEAASSDPITLPEMLQRAHSGRLNGEVPHRLASTDLANLMVVPSGTTDDLQLALDGLPPLLEALATTQIDVTVIAGPAFLEDPNATIFAWATRSVLWAIETGEVTEEQAREAAARLVLAGVTPFGVAMVGKEV